MNHLSGDILVNRSAGHTRRAAGRTSTVAIAVLVACADAIAGAGGAGWGGGEPPQYRATVLPGLYVDGSASARAFVHGLNDHGLAVGYSQTHDHRYRAVAWRDGAVSALGMLPGFTDSFARGVNNHGVIVGMMEDDSVSPPRRVPVKWTDGVPERFDPLPGSEFSDAWAINDAGLVAGSGTDGDESGAALLSGDYLRLLPPVYGKRSPFAIGINEANTTIGAFTHLDGRSRAAKWLNGARQIPLDGPDAYDSYPRAINNSEWVVGYAFTVPGEGAPYGLLWKDTLPIVLPTPGLSSHAAFVRANDINDAGQIVGNYALDSGFAALALWQDGEMIDVREYIHPDDSDLCLEYLSHINNAGVIVSSTSIGGVQLPVLLTPVPEADAAVVLLMTIPAARKRQRRGAPHAGD